MLAATYDLAIARVDQIKEVEVRSIGLQRPLFAVSRRTGQWSQTVPWTLSISRPVCVRRTWSGQQQS